MPSIYGREYDWRFRHIPPKEQSNSRKIEIHTEAECKVALDRLEALLQSYLNGYPLQFSKPFDTRTVIKSQAHKVTRPERREVVQLSEAIAQYFIDKKSDSLSYRDFSKRGTHTLDTLKTRAAEIFRNASFLRTDSYAVASIGMLFDPFSRIPIQAYLFDRDRTSEKASPTFISRHENVGRWKVPTPYGVDQFGGSFALYGFLPYVNTSDIEGDLKRLKDKTFHKDKVEWDTTLGALFLSINNEIMETIIATAPQGTDAINAQVGAILEARVIKNESLTDYQRYLLYTSLMTHADSIADRIMTLGGELFSDIRRTLQQIDLVVNPNQSYMQLVRAIQVLLASTLSEVKPTELTAESVKKTNFIRGSLLLTLMSIFDTKKSENILKKPSIFSKISKLFLGKYYELFNQANTFRKVSANFSLPAESTFSNLRLLLISTKHTFFPGLSAKNPTQYYQEQHEVNAIFNSTIANFLKKGLEEKIYTANSPALYDFSDPNISLLSKMFNFAIFSQNAVDQHIQTDPLYEKNIHDLNTIIHQILLVGLGFRHAYMFKTALANQWEAFSSQLDFDSFPPCIQAHAIEDPRHGGAIRLSLTKDGQEIPLADDSLLLSILQILTSKNAAIRKAIHVKPGSLFYFD